MKPAKIQKVKGVGQNVIFQLLNEQSISIILIFLFGVSLFYLVPDLALHHKVGITSVFGLGVYFLLATEIEGQKMYSLAPKLLSYTYRPKRLQKLSDLEFLASEEVLVMNDRILSVFCITPIDYALLHPDEQDQFVNQITVFLNNLKQEHIQLVIKNRKATSKDYLTHFDSVDTSMATKATTATQQRREKHLIGYKQNLEELIQNNIIPIREYFLLIEEPCQTTSQDQINKKLSRIREKGDRVFRNLHRCQITSKRLTGSVLESFCNQQFQIK